MAKGWRSEALNGLVTGKFNFSPVPITFEKRRRREMTFGPHNVCDTRDVKVYIIGLLKRGIKTFDERTSKSDLKPLDEELYERERFSAMLEEFVDILEEDWEEM